jgi:hypothetical protein
MIKRGKILMDFIGKIYNNEIGCDLSKFVFKKQSLENYDDGSLADNIASELENSLETLYFWESYNDICRKNSVLKYKMCMKLINDTKSPSKYTDSVESYLRDVMSMEDDGSDKNDDSNNNNSNKNDEKEKQKNGIMKRIIESMKRVFNVVANFIKKIWNDISTFFGELFVKFPAKPVDIKYAKQAVDDYIKSQENPQTHFVVLSVNVTTSSTLDAYIQKCSELNKKVKSFAIQRDMPQNEADNLRDSINKQLDEIKKFVPDVSNIESKERESELMKSGISEKVTGFKCISLENNNIGTISKTISEPNSLFDSCRAQVKNLEKKMENLRKCALQSKELAETMEKEHNSNKIAIDILKTFSKTSSTFTRLLDGPVKAIKLTYELNKKARKLAHSLDKNEENNNENQNKENNNNEKPQEEKK